MTPDLETRLRRELGRRGDALTDAPLTFDAVAGRARRIRRRQRRTAVLGVAAAVAALAVPAALVAPEVTDRPAPTPATRTPSPPVLDDPLVPYVRDDALLRPDGGRTALPDGDWQDVALLADGRMILTRSTDDGDLEAVSVDGDRDGEIGGPSPLSGRVVTDAPGDAAAWTRPDGSVVVLGSDGAVTDLPGARLSGVELANPTVVALLGDTCGEVRTGDDCRVVLQGMLPDGTVTNLVSRHPDAMAQPFVPALGSVSDVSADGRFVAGQISVTDEGGCSGLWSVERSAMLWRDCNLNRMEFAPDGRHLYAVDVRSDGYGPTKGYVVGVDDDIVDATLDPDGTILDVAWETNGSLLAVVDREGVGTFLVRLTLDGDEEDLVGPLPGGELGPDGVPVLMLP